VIKSISIIVFICFFGCSTVFSQKKTIDVPKSKDSLKSKDIDPLTPAKAAFYSAILPGLGQAYNKKYWKIPIVYIAIGISLDNYIKSVKSYDSFRNAYKRRLEGYFDDEYKSYDNEKLLTGQRFYQRNKDFSALFVVAFYALNIIDANVDAALIQFNVNENLSLKPDIYTNDVTFKPNLALTLNYKF
jgi:hypothetical protein